MARWHVSKQKVVCQCRAGLDSEVRIYSVIRTLTAFGSRKLTRDVTLTICGGESSLGRRVATLAPPFDTTFKVSIRTD
jgi:hypothetical protein